MKILKKLPKLPKLPKRQKKVTDGKDLKILFGIRGKLTMAVVVFLLSLLAFTIITAMDREIDYATKASNIRALENILVLEKIFSDYFIDRIEFRIEKNKKKISDVIDKKYYISNYKKSKKFRLKYILDEEKFEKIPEYKKKYYNYVKFSYYSVFARGDLVISKKWKNDIDEFNAFWQWQESNKSRYRMLESRIHDITENINKGFFNFQFLTIYSRKATRYFPLPAKLIWFQQKKYPFEYKLHKAIRNINKDKEKKSKDDEIDFLFPATNENKDRLLLKPLFVDYKPPLKDVSIIIYKILSDKMDWHDFRIDDDTKKKFSFFYEEKVQDLLKKFKKEEKRVIEELKEIDEKLVIYEKTLEEAKIQSLEEEFDEEKNIVESNFGNYFDKEWYKLNDSFTETLRKKNGNLISLLNGIGKEMQKSLIKPYVDESKKLKTRLGDIQKDQRDLNRKVKKQKAIVYRLKRKQQKTRKKDGGKNSDEESLPEEDELNEYESALEKLNQEEVEIEGILSSLRQNYLGKIYFPNLFVKTLKKKYYNFDKELYLHDIIKPSIMPHDVQQELRKRGMLSLRSRAGAVLKDLYYGIITTSVVFTAEEKVIKKRTNWWLVFGGIIVSIGFVISFVFSTVFAREMKTIAEKTKIIGEGRLDVLFKVNRSDELGLIAHELNGMVSGLREKKVIKSTFGRIVDPRVRDHLLKGGLELGGDIKKATILFSDIRGFTTMSEALSPEEVVSLLNRYFEKMSVCINEYDGIINKFIGDAILAVFGVPIEVGNHAQKAVNAAIMMLNANKQLNEELKKEGLMAIRSGIGIHTGPVLSGNIGSKDRMEYTVIGDTVNVASRIEGLCKTYQKKLIISESTLKKLSNKYQEKALFLDDVKVKGKNASIKVYSF